MITWLKNLITRSHVEQEQGFRRAGNGLILEGNWDSQGDKRTPVPVTPTSVKGIPAWKHAVDLISNKVAGCKAHTFRHLPNGGREFAKDHPSYNLVRRQANPYLYLSPGDVFRTALADALQGGNGYIHIRRFGATPDSLWNLNPDNVLPTIVHYPTSQELLYVVQDAKGQKIVVPPSDMIHLKGMPGECGLIGLSPLDYAAEVLGIAVAQHRYASVFFETGGAVDCWVEVPEGSFLDDEKQIEVKAALKRWFGGIDKSRDPIVLSGGAKLHKTFLDNNNSQLLQSRAYTQTDIASLMSIVASKINGTGTGSYGSLEQDALSATGDTYQPWIDQLSSQLEKLLREDEKEEYYIEFDTSKLVAGTKFDATNERNQRFLNGGIGWKEYRTEQNLPTDLEADIFIVPAGYVLLKDLVNPPKPEVVEVTDPINPQEKNGKSGNPDISADN